MSVKRHLHPNAALTSGALQQERLPLAIFSGHLLTLLVALTLFGLPGQSQAVQTLPADPSTIEFEPTLKKALRGEPEAQFQLGQMYELGQETTQSDSEAAQWYRRSADQGYARAQARLGDLFKAGKGVDQSEIEAVQWYRRAAQQGNPSAQNSLAAMLYEGRGVAQDRREARAWWQKAADQGDPVAKVILAQLPQGKPTPVPPASTDTPTTPPKEKRNPTTTEPSPKVSKDSCEGLSNGTPVTVRLAGYPQAFGAMVLEASRGRASVQVMDVSAPLSASGRRINTACKSLVRQK